MKQLRCFDINWDTDNENVDLPQETILVVDEDFNIDSDTADALSDKFGWCVFSVGAEFLPEEVS